MVLYLKKLFMVGRNYPQSFKLSSKSAQFGDFCQLCRSTTGTSSDLTVSIGLLLPRPTYALSKCYFFCTLADILKHMLLDTRQTAHVSMALLEISFCQAGAYVNLQIGHQMMACANGAPYKLIKNPVWRIFVVVTVL